jgi:hypothetical protein
VLPVGDTVPLGEPDTVRLPDGEGEPLAVALAEEPRVAVVEGVPVLEGVGDAVLAGVEVSEPVGDSVGEGVGVALVGSIENPAVGAAGGVGEALAEAGGQVMRRTA